MIYDFDTMGFIDPKKPLMEIPEYDTGDIKVILGKFTKTIPTESLYVHGSPITFSKCDRPIWLSDDMEVAKSYGCFTACFNVISELKTLCLVEALTRTEDASTEARTITDDDFECLIRCLHEDYPQEQVEAMVKKFRDVGLADTHWGVIDIHDDRVKNKITRLGFDAVYIEDVPEYGYSKVHCNALFVLGFKKLQLISWKASEGC